MITHKTLLLFLVIAFGGLLTSCETKKSQLNSVSPDGSTQLIVDGTKSAMEPWDLNLQIKGKDNKNKEVKTQLYGDEITNKNVVISWQDNTTCTIILIDQDDTQRTLVMGL